MTPPGSNFLLLPLLACLAGTAPGTGSALSFSRHARTYGTDPTFQIALGDLDGDGDLDAVFANMFAAKSRVLLNDGEAGFTDTGQELTEQAHGVGIGDLDGDGDLDLFMTCAGYAANGTVSRRPSRVYLNDGAAHFTDTGQDLGDTDSSGNAVELVDVDGDGDLDAYVYYYQAEGRIFLNDGRGGFSPGAESVSDRAGWGDLDGDGDVDMIVRERAEGRKVLLNDGSGHYGLHWSEPDTSVSWPTPLIGDIDGDGDLDLLDADGDQEQNRPVRIWLNDGGGRFTEHPGAFGSIGPSRLRLADLDGDTDLDVVLVTVFGGNQIWLNDGTGAFTDSGLRFGDVEVAGEPAIGDLDGDGDLDLFVPCYGDGGPNEVWLNVGR